MKLGRRAVKYDSRTLRLVNYLTASLPNPPQSYNPMSGSSYFGMMKNDMLGCCTIAAIGHAIQTWTKCNGKEVTVSDDVIVEYYSKWDGYVAGNPNTDQGGIELDVLKQWKNSDFSGHLLTAFADAFVHNHKEIQQAIWLFGGLYIGMLVPNFIMQDVPGIWDVTEDDGGIDGGHAVWVCGYDSSGVYFISWGSVYKMTWAYWDKYVDESHVLLSPDIINSATNKAPTGFDILGLQADLALIH